MLLKVSENHYINPSKIIKVIKVPFGKVTNDRGICYIFLEGMKDPSELSVESSEKLLWYLDTVVGVQSVSKLFEKKDEIEGLLEQVKNQGAKNGENSN